MSNKRTTHATLPASLETETVEGMAVGQVAYTMPWAMWVDNDRHCWLNPRYSVTSAPSGTSEMRIELLHDGYHVRAPYGKTWSPQESATYADQKEVEFLPVANLIF